MGQSLRVVTYESLKTKEKDQVNGNFEKWLHSFMGTITRESFQLQNFSNIKGFYN